ncbi:MAG: hypothetical protein HFF26_04285 [Oscillospiraceae bacterium]|nr:hypothetical protein [Oscillospiraceae bacterium]
MSKARGAGRSRTGGLPPERVFGSFLHGQKGTRRRRETEAARRTGIILPRPGVQTLKNEIFRKTGIFA